MLLPSSSLPCPSSSPFFFHPIPESSLSQSGWQHSWKSHLLSPLLPKSKSIVPFPFQKPLLFVLTLSGTMTICNLVPQNCWLKLRYVPTRSICRCFLITQRRNFMNHTVSLGRCKMRKGRQDVLPSSVAALKKGTDGGGGLGQLSY